MKKGLANPVLHEIRSPNPTPPRVGLKTPYNTYAQSIEGMAESGYNRNSNKLRQLQEDASTLALSGRPNPDYNSKRFYGLFGRDAVNEPQKAMSHAVSEQRKATEMLRHGNTNRRLDAKMTKKTNIHKASYSNALGGSGIPQDMVVQPKKGRRYKGMPDTSMSIVSKQATVKKRGAIKKDNWDFWNKPKSTLSTGPMEAAKAGALRNQPIAPKPNFFNNWFGDEPDYGTGGSAIGAAGVATGSAARRKANTRLGAKIDNNAYLSSLLENPPRTTPKARIPAIISNELMLDNMLNPKSIGNAVQGAAQTISAGNNFVNNIPAVSAGKEMLGTKVKQVGNAISAGNNFINTIPGVSAGKKLLGTGAKYVGGPYALLVGGKNLVQGWFNNQPSAVNPALAKNPPANYRAPIIVQEKRYDASNTAYPDLANDAIRDEASKGMAGFAPENAWRPKSFNDMTPEEQEWYSKYGRPIEYRVPSDFRNTVQTILEQVGSYIPLLDVGATYGPATSPYGNALGEKAQNWGEWADLALGRQGPDQERAKGRPQTRVIGFAQGQSRDGKVVAPEYLDIKELQKLYKEALANNDTEAMQDYQEAMSYSGYDHPLRELTINRIDDQFGTNMVPLNNQYSVMDPNAYTYGSDTNLNLLPKTDNDWFYGSEIKPEDRYPIYIDDYDPYSGGGGYKGYYGDDVYENPWKLRGGVQSLDALAPLVDNATGLAQLIGMLGAASPGGTGGYRNPWIQTTQNPTPFAPDQLNGLIESFGGKQPAPKVQKRIKPVAKSAKPQQIRKYQSAPATDSISKRITPMGKYERAPGQADANVVRHNKYFTKGGK